MTERKRISITVEEGAQYVPAFTEQKVGMGEIRVVKGVGILRTLLGSCIGLVLYDAKQRVGGLAHIVLPRSSGEGLPAGKYADTAVPELLRQMELLGGNMRGLSAKLAGGAKMFASSGPGSIGEQNRAAVEQLLKRSGIPVLGCDCGGQQGRRMALDVATGKVTVELVGGTPREL